MPGSKWKLFRKPGCTGCRSARIRRPLLMTPRGTPVAGFDRARHEELLDL